MSYIVYILYNIDREKIYIGRTCDLERRIKRHNKILPSKKTSFTAKNTGLWMVIYSENYLTLKESILREKWFKSGIGREFIQKNVDTWVQVTLNGRSAAADF
jgi:putative endonuclease